MCIENTWEFLKTVKRFPYINTNSGNAVEVLVRAIKGHQLWESYRRILQITSNATEVFQISLNNYENNAT